MEINNDIIRYLRKKHKDWSEDKIKEEAKKIWKKYAEDNKEQLEMHAKQDKESFERSLDKEFMNLWLDNQESHRKVVFIDMDGVIVDLSRAIKNWFGNNPKLEEKYMEHPDLIPEIFKDPLPVEGAIESIKKLEASARYDLFIATTTPWGNPEAATHKRLWIENYFGDLFKKKMIITHHKNLLIGDYLIDERDANGAADFKGELLSFGWAYEKEEWNLYKTWEDILNKLL
jgi:5'-nucleotidase